MKKRRLLFGTMVLFALGFLHACDLIEECGTCKLVTEYADGTTSEGTPLPFCGEDLSDKEDSPPVTVGGVTTYWECY